MTQPSLRQMFSGVSSALAADALDHLDLRNQCLDPDVMPLAPSHTLLGPAFCLRAEPARDTRPAMPYQGLLRAMEHVRADEIVVFATGRSDAAGVWGELITAACQARRVAGALTDGLIRDAAQLARGPFPIFSRGTVPYDSKGRLDVVAHGDPVTLGNVTIRPGDVLIGDLDGVTVVPAEVAGRVAELVASKRAAEDAFRAAAAESGSLTDAFQRYGVL
ncbi:ribonuclease activity regulator RraA [Nonomuraea roseoviolacea subsp. roseoviolacea]|uniref:RraA family protein n=1 Tax=Nonomuraea roseoviolacea TaxID=103837 RepID=UPI0031DBE59F